LIADPNFSSDTPITTSLFFFPIVVIKKFLSVAFKTPSEISLMFSSAFSAEEKGKKLLSSTNFENFFLS